MQLITYADRLGGDLRGLRSLLDEEFAGLFDGVHVLPFFDPMDGADAGFDPIDHTKVDPRLGDWGDVESLAADYRVMADMIVNHISAESTQFADVRQHGPQSRHWDLFLRKDAVFGDDPETANLGAIYRPRPGIPFTTIALADGSRHEFWTTFSPNQLDIDVEGPQGQAYLDSILRPFARSGITEIRLDAAGYAIKRRGTSCFMLPETFEFIAALSRQAGELGIDSLVEIHAHYQTQIDIASRIGRVYDFALPPLVLHTLNTGNTEALERWLTIAPRNCVTVLDTHDGIGILDAARQGDRPGLLTDAEIDRLVETIHAKTNGTSLRASGHAASNLDIYQVNSTYYDALGGDDVEYLIARAIQFFAPGTPQIYYVGLLAGGNDMTLVERTGVGRDINRHYYQRDEIRAALGRPVVRRLTELMRWRRAMDVFDGQFSIVPSPHDELVLKWRGKQSLATMHVEFSRRRARIDHSGPEGAGQIVIDDAWLAAAAT